ncbi:hypothetical protein NECAME_16328 [Necator americanus]|uniref:Uncharacterized protein n=1 Tax=Necator americanus TaxID=51031 RepID=W2TZD6_NECAM|nr:hypothetical protein NECAME_16328 [Necator americanus]ETN86426.1 hypothetical protein NECAME_16328 [Necator americanus]
MQPVKRALRRRLRARREAAPGGNAQQFFERRWREPRTVRHAVDRRAIPVGRARVGDPWQPGALLRERPAERPLQHAVADQVLLARRTAFVVECIRRGFFAQLGVERHVQQRGTVLIAAEHLRLHEAPASEVALVAENPVQFEWMTDRFVNLQHHLVRHQQQVARARRAVRCREQLQRLVRYTGAGAIEAIDDLLAHGYVKCRRGLVGEQQAWAARERHRDHRTLALSARQLVRKAVDATLRLGNAGPPKQFDTAPACRAGAQTFVDAEALGNLLAYCGRHRFLKDHGNIGSANAAHLLLGFLQKILAVEQHTSREPRMLDEAKDRQCSHALARPRLPDERDTFAACNRKTQFAHRHFLAEAHAKALNIQQRTIHYLPPPNAEPRVRVSSALRSASPMNQLAKARRRWRHAQPEEVETRERENGRTHAKRQERDDRRQAVGQHVAPHDLPVRQAHRSRRLHVV